MDVPDLIAVGANLATIVGIPLALAAYLADLRRTRREREYGTYDALDEKYLEYLRMVIERPELDLYHRPLDPAPALDAHDRIRQRAMFEVFVSLLERSFLMYRDQSTDLKRAQWAGWVAFLDDWTTHPTFQRLWREAVDQDDADFVGFVSARMSGAPRLAERRPRGEA